MKCINAKALSNPAYTATVVGPPTLSHHGGPPRLLSCIPTRNLLREMCTIIWCTSVLSYFTTKNTSLPVQKSYFSERKYIISGWRMCPETGSDLFSVCRQFRFRIKIFKPEVTYFLFENLDSVTSGREIWLSAPEVIGSKFFSSKTSFPDWKWIMLLIDTFW